MKNELYFNDKKTFGDVVSNIWNAISGDKILAGMGLITVLSLVGAVIDQNYSLKLDDKSIDLHPDDTAS